MISIMKIQKYLKDSPFDNEERTVAQFRDHACDDARMQRLFDRLDSFTDRFECDIPHTHADKKSNQDRRPRSKSFPYDFNRLGRERSTYLNASDVTLRDGQEYILGSCPYSLDYMNDLFNALIHRNTRVMVALHQKDEKTIESTFWKNKTLQKLSLSDGWKVEHKKEQKKLLAYTDDASIIERTLSLTKGPHTRTITLLHYKGWKDGRAAPSEALLLQLLTRIDEIGGKIWINCKGGNGRTGQVALLHWAKQKIDRARKTGADIKLNIPEMLTELRSQRRKLVSRSAQLQQVYTTLHRYLSETR